MAASGNPSSSSGLQWPLYNTSQSLGIRIDNSTNVSVINYTVCEFWDALDAKLLNFTSGNATTTGGSPSPTSSVSSAAVRSMFYPLIGVQIVILATVCRLMALI